jgi:hypothetical protein
MTRALLLCALLAACGGGGGGGGDDRAKEPAVPAGPHRYRYTCDAKQVFDAVVAAVRAEAPPLDASDAAAGLVTTQLQWHDGRGERKHPSQPILKEDLGLILELAVVKSGGFHEVRATARVFDSGPAGRGPELERDRPGWPDWADKNTTHVLDTVERRLVKCAARPDA